MAKETGKKVPQKGVEEKRSNKPDTRTSDKQKPYTPKAPKNPGTGKGKKK